VDGEKRIAIRHRLAFAGGEKLAPLRRPAHHLESGTSVQLSRGKEERKKPRGGFEKLNR
jgi:hypothetical protein